jgi:hypothetical protein
LHTGTWCATALHRHWWNAAHLLYALFRRQADSEERSGKPTGKQFRVEAVSLTLKKGKTATAPDGDADLSEVWQVRVDDAAVWRL